jgi:ribulose 1,5-bisphosphate synthetase/thiazole synthase
MQGEDMQQKQVISSGYVVSEQANAPVEDYDVVLIGGGVAGYVAAIKAGQEGMKVRELSWLDAFEVIAEVSLYR